MPVDINLSLVIMVLVYNQGFTVLYALYVRMKLQLFCNPMKYFQKTDN